MNTENYSASDKDLEAIEKKISLLYFEDGFWDLIMGFTLVAFGIGAAVYDYLPDPMNSILGPMLWLIGFIGFLLAKRFITVPRLGFVKYKPRKRKRLKLLVIITAIFVILTIVAVILTALELLTFSGLGIGTAIIFGLMPVTIFSGLALLLNYNRIFIHAIVYGAAFFTNEILNIYGYSLYGGIAMIACGMIIMVMGFVYLVKFLRKYSTGNGDEIDV
jgi:hypothetical protein